MKTIHKLTLAISALLMSGLGNAGTVRTAATGTINWSSPSSWIREFSGTVTTLSGSTILTGTGTSFNTDIQVGDVIISQLLPTNLLGTVASIQSNTQLTLTNASTTSTTYSYGKRSVPTSSDDVYIDNTNISGNSSIDITLDLSSATIASLTFVGTNKSSNLIHSGSNALLVNGNVTIGQPLNNNKTCHWQIGSGSATVTGNLNIGGNNTTTTRIAKVSLSKGTLNLTGNLVYNSASGVSGTARLDMSGGAGLLNIAGLITLTNASGTLVSGTVSTIKFTGNIAQTINLSGVMKYNNIITANTSLLGVTTGAAITSPNVQGNIQVISGIFRNGGFAIAGNLAKTFEVANGATFTLSETSTSPTGFGSLLYGASSNTEFTGTTQIIGAATYGNLLLSGTGTKSESATITVGGNLLTAGTTTFSSTGPFTVLGNVTIALGTTVTMSSNTHTYKGNFVKTGTFNCGTGSVLFSNTGAAQTLTGSTTFMDFQINNAFGLNLMNDITVNGTLTFTSGKIITGLNTVIMGSSSSVSSASSTTGWVQGRLNKTLGTLTTSIRFEVGDATNYAPLNYASLLVSVAGTLTVSTTGTDHTNLSTSSYTPLRTVNRYWTVTNTGISMGAYSLTASFNAGNMDSGLNTDACQILIYNSTNWLVPAAGTRTAASTQATGISLIGDVQIGEIYSAPILGSISPSSGNRLQTLDVQFSGSNFVSGVSSVSCGTGIIVNSMTVNSSTSITANITIASSATTGTRNFSVANSLGISSGKQSFTINNPAPVLLSATPLTANRGETLDITLTGSGFFVNKTDGNTGTLDITDPQNTGTINFPVTYTPSSPALPLHDRWNLLSNPYPCTIDWQATTGWTKSNVEPTYYCWDRVVKDYKFFQSGVSGNSSCYVRSIQGFWVKASGSSPVLSATEYVKAPYSGSSQFYKVGNSISDAVSLIIQNVADSTKFDEAFLRFASGATAGFDPEFDSHRLLSTTSIIPNISTLSTDNLLLALNSMASLDQNIVIPVVVRTNSSGSFTFSMNDIDNLPSSTCIILEDTQTGTLTNLWTSTYTCSITVTISSTPRFNLRIAPPLKMQSIMPTCATEKNGMIIAKGQSNGPWSYTWKNSSGTILKTTTATTEADTLKNLSGGTYSVAVTNSTGYCSIIKETVVISEPTAISGNPVLSHIKCFGDKNGKATLFTSGGNEPYEYYWSNGATASAVENLAGGEYTVMISDINTCMETVKILIVEPAELTAALQVDDVGYCMDDNGAIDLNVSGGEKPYTYTWSKGTTKNTGTISGLSPDRYDVVVTDKNSCELTKSIDIVKLNPVKAGFSANADTVYMENGVSIFFSNETGGNADYSWDFGDGATSTEESPTHSFTSTGSFLVTLSINSGGCLDQMVMRVTVVSPNEQKNSFSIYPNPNTGDYLKIFLKDNDDKEILIVVYDASGRTIMTKSISKSNDQFVLDLQSGTNGRMMLGNYIVSVVTKEKSLSKKLIITSFGR